jgi:putative hemolysin
MAATYIKKLAEVSNDSPLWQGQAPNPSQNYCQNIGGAAVGFAADGGFVNSLGHSDICVFGDGSMVSGWSLIYMANHRDGYDEIKEKVKAQPLNIRIPS